MLMNSLISTNSHFNSRDTRLPPSQGTALSRSTKQARPTKDRFSASKTSPEELPNNLSRGLVKLLKPLKRGAMKAAQLGKTVKSGFITAVQVAPTLGTLVAASALARVEGLLPGREKLSGLEWLQERDPKRFNKTLENAARMVGSSTVDSTGLSVGDLLEIEEHIYKSLAPERDTFGRKTPARFLSQLATAPFRQPGAPHAAFVYLGEGREKDSRELMNLWNQDMPPDTNPYSKENDLHRVWEVLEEKAAEKKLPVFIDLDGDARTFTSTEYVSKEIMNSMVTKHNDLGDGFQDAGLYYSWLDTRQKSYYESLHPWMERKNPDLAAKLQDIKANLAPPWLGGKEGIGPWPSPRKADRAFSGLMSLAKDSGQNATKLGDFSDALVALDRDIVTATMTHWIKLLKEAGAHKRSELLAPLAKVWTKLNVGSAVNPELATPKGAPRLKALEGPPPVEISRQYDRAIGLGEVVDHTLKGLGIVERKQFMELLQQEWKKELPFLQGQDNRLAALLGDKYEGIDFKTLLHHREQYDEVELHRRLEQLKGALREDDGLSRKDKAQLHRHHSVVDWMVRSQKRYGEVPMGLLGQAAIFKDHPLAVSQFFEQAEKPSLVTTLGAGPHKVQELGDKHSPHSLKISIFREGGGGKGMAYPTPTKALKSGLNSINYQFDDGGGSSAGVIPSLLEAAGFSDEELEEISARLDFKEFNSDAIPLLGGTDPKIGGINHTGMFSSQKMYRELYDLVSKKLGIEGRPILFRDLPQRLSVTGTVINTDLPADDPLRKLIDADKRFFMNPEDTPNFDVIGAVTASTAVPAYFSAPQLHVTRSEEKNGKIESKLYRMQFVDGGLVDNFPLSAARRDENEKTALVVVPAYYEAIDPVSGETVSLSTLNFDDTHLATVNEKNASYYRELMPKLDSFMKRVAQEGYDRVVFAMNLSDLEEQAVPLIQGQSKAETEQLLDLAREEGLDSLGATQGRQFIDATIHRPSPLKTLAGAAFNLFIDGQEGEHDEYHWGLKASHSHPGISEEENILQLIRSVGASALSSDEKLSRARRFEKD